MKIHHVTDEWDYTLGVEEIGRYYYLTLSILRQPDRVPNRDLDGIQVRSWLNSRYWRHLGSFTERTYAITSLSLSQIWQLLVCSGSIATNGRVLGEEADKEAKNFD